MCVYKILKIWFAVLMNISQGSVDTESTELEAYTIFGLFVGPIYGLNRTNDILMLN